MGRTFTQNTIAIGGSESGTFLLTVPTTIPLNFNIQAVVDDIGNGNGIVNELNENNKCSYKKKIHSLKIC